MQRISMCVAVCLLGGALTAPGIGSTIYSNPTPNGAMAIATRPDSPGESEIEAGDDFLLGSSATINSGSFTGLLVPGANGGFPTVQDVVVEIYREFPKDSTVPSVGNRVNSPSDIAFDSFDAAASDLSFSTAVLASTFTAANSVQPGGIDPGTGGDGGVTGQEVQFNFIFTTPLNLPADHYFFVPQVEVSGGEFYWLSASRPISGAGTTPFSPDLQVWTRDANHDPDWLRVGTDIVGGTTPPTFNAAFSLQGTVAPEPSFIWVILAVGLSIAGVRRYVAIR